MKKIKFALIFLFVLTFMYGINKIEASTISDFTSKDLMYIEVNGTGRIITKTTTIDDIKSWYGGEAQLETESLWGGKAYSFYIGDYYDDYLYIETLSDGQIFSYGSTDPSYQTNTYSFGDDYPYSERNALYGCLLSDDGTIIGGIYYYKSILEKGSSTKIIKLYKEAFGLDTDTDTLDDDKQKKAMLNLNKHATLMFNSIERYFGNEEGFLTFNEDYFYTNQQFREFGTNLQSFMYNMDYSTSYYSTLGTKTKCDLAYSVYYCLNPLQLAGMAKMHKYADYTDKCYPVWDYNYETKILVGAVFSKDCFERADEVTLTSTEISRLGVGRREYEEAIDCFEAATNELYETTPVYSSASGLVAGELLDTNKKGITHYINAIREAAGMSPLSIDEEGFNIAQHMSTLLAYRGDVLYLAMAHAFTKPDGVSDDFYYTALGWENSYASNLAHVTSSASQEIMKLHINLLIYDDGGTTSFTYGHRESLLRPTYSRWGYGITSGYGVVEMNGSDSSYSTVAAGWPSVNGITFLETIYNDYGASSNRFKWTCKFYSTYEVQDTTTATVECLNTGDVWTFTEEETSSTRIYQNLLDGDVITSASNKVLIYDSTIEPRAGYVYLVTLNGLKNTETGATESYSYRTVFEYADEDTITSSNSVTIDTSNLYEVEGRTAVYKAPVGMELNLKIELGDSTAIDKKVTWTSSNPDIVTVTQDGTICGVIPSDQEVVITVKIDGSDASDQIVVMPYISLEDVSLNESSLSMSVDAERQNEVSTFYIETVPEEVEEILDTTWVLSDGTNRYILTEDSDGSYSFETTAGDSLEEYIEVTDVQKDSSGVIQQISIRALALKDGITLYELQVYVTAMSDMYNDEQFGGKCSIAIDSPITSVETYLDGTLVEDKYSIEVKGNNEHTYTLSAKALPEDATQELTDVTWESSDESIATVDKNGKLTVLATGTVTITRKGLFESSFELTITAPITSLELSTSLVNKNSDGAYLKAYSEGVLCTEEIVVSRTPDINTETLIYTVIEGEDIAQMLDNTVKFTGCGTVTVKVSDSSGECTQTISFEVIPTVKNFEFGPASSTNSGSDENSSYEYLNINFDALASGGTVEYDGYKASYNLPDGVSTGPTITYSVESDADFVTVDSEGKLTITGGGTATISASVPTADGTDLVVQYTLISNKAMSIDDVILEEPSNVVSVKQNEDGENVYYIYKNVEYTFEVNKSEKDTSNADLSARISSFSKDYLTAQATDNKLKVKATTSGETSLVLMADVTNYVPVNASGEVVDYSNSQEVKATTTSKEFTINLCILDYLKGDMDKNGYVNSADAAIVLDRFKNGDVTQEDILIGDMNEDGVLNSTDASMILDIYKNK